VARVSDNGRRRVVVTGLGMVTPLGNTVEDSWSALIAGESGAGRITQFDPTGFPVDFACEVKDLEITDYIEHKASRRMDRFTHLALAAARQAEADAKLDIAPEADRIGAAVATGIGGLKSFEACIQVLDARGPDRVNPFSIVQIIPNLAAGWVSMELGTKGPLLSECTACAASNMAIGDGLDAIRLGRADVMICGGTEAPVSRVGIAGFGAMRAISRRNGDPKAASRPFDLERDGFVMGEAAAMVVLEELEHANARGAKIYAELLGYGLSSDATHVSDPDPTGESPARALQMAFDDARITPDQVGYVVMGEVLQAGVGMIPSRQVSAGVGCPVGVGSDTINKVCASGMRATAYGDLLIRSGDHDVVLTGGMESMSNAPYLVPKARFGYTMGDGVLVDHMTSDGLTSTFTHRIMAEENSVVSSEIACSRADQDAWALRSHERAVAAQDAGHLADEIVAVTVPGRKGDVVDADEGPRRDTSAERLAALKPVFSKDGATTAGNAPGVNDGAAALVLASEEWAGAQGLTPLARILSEGHVADDYPYLVRTPAAAARAALERAGMTVADVDLFEINEAFCSVVLSTIDLLGADADRFNVQGGAVAFGHPIGASGARLVGTLVHQLRRRGGGIGLAAICSGAAQGDAMLLEVLPA